MPPVRLAVVGFGQIARNRHLPVIAAGGLFEVVAIASDTSFDPPPGVKAYADYRHMLADGDFEAVAVCTPPAVRAAIAADALRAGRHVLLEKPPAATLGEVEALVDIAHREGRTLFAAWHSHFSRGVAEARDRLRSRPIRRLSAIWHEDVERWHPGQTWIWQPKGFGVFDAGSNALSILARIIPAPIVVTAAEFDTEPGRAMPMAARLRFTVDQGPVEHELDLDWRVRVDRREINIDCEDGTTLRLLKSGRQLDVDGETVVNEENQEYPRLYEHFRDLIAGGRSEVDAAPLRLIADAFLVARRK